MAEYIPDWILSWMESQSDADVVEVVRCKECTYYEGNRCGFWEEYPKTEKNDFCSNGEKRAK